MKYKKEYVDIYLVDGNNRSKIWFVEREVLIGSDDYYGTIKQYTRLMQMLYEYLGFRQFLEIVID